MKKKEYLYVIDYILLTVWYDEYFLRKRVRDAIIMYSIACEADVTLMALRIVTVSCFIPAPLSG